MSPPSTAPASRHNADNDTASHILTLWGMADLGSSQTDVYTLAMTYDPDEARKGTEEKGLGLDRFIIGNTPLEVREGRFDYDVRRDPARAGNGNDLPDPVFLTPFSPFTARPH